MANLTIIMKLRTKLHFRRFEFKYLLPARLTDRLIPSLRHYMDWDPYALNGERKSYMVNSLYFDSRNFRNYYQKIDGLKKRKKFRIRYYGNELNSSTNVFLEYKRKDDMVVKKDRVMISWEEVNEVIKRNGKLKDIEKRDDDFARELKYDLISYGMKPKVWVGYWRKPLIGKNDSNIRVTFDYGLKAERCGGMVFKVAERKIFPEYLIMEIKYNRIMPWWLHDLIKKFQLQRGAHSKYCYGVERVYWGF